MEYSNRLHTAVVTHKNTGHDAARGQNSVAHWFEVSILLVASEKKKTFFEGLTLISLKYRIDIFFNYVNRNVCFSLFSSDNFHASLKTANN